MTWTLPRPFAPRSLWLLALALFVGAPRPAAAQAAADAAFAEASANAALAHEGLRRSLWFTRAWLEHADPATGLIPRNLGRSRDLWNAKDAAADNYPFMVLTAALTDSALFAGRLRNILATERRLATRSNGLPDDFSFSKGGFATDRPGLDDQLFGASEYVKDGLLPLTEWLGPSPWSERMVELVDAIWVNANVETPHGAIPTANVEVHGELMQALARLYWMTGTERYLDYAVRLGDYYLLGDRHPTRDTDHLRLRDHGGEIVNGLAELYATVHHARPAKAAAYRAPLHALLDRVLDVGRTADGLFYNAIDPQTGAVLDSAAADTWGYLLDGYYTVHLVDGVPRYRDAVRRALGALWEGYRGYDWENGSHDGYADAIESALNLYHCEPVASAARWLDDQTQVLWAMQDASAKAPRWAGSGVIEGWHGDGNFARTSIMYSLWKSQGLHARPWRDDVRVGATRRGDTLYVHVEADAAWAGRLAFDRPRHRDHLGLPLDWPRINQFPEWFAVDADAAYAVTDAATGERRVYRGADLHAGLPLKLGAGEAQRLVVTAEN